MAVQQSRQQKLESQENLDEAVEEFTFAEYTVWEQRYTMKLTIEIDPDRAITEIATEVLVDHDLPAPDDAANPIVETLTQLPEPSP